MSYTITAPGLEHILIAEDGGYRCTRCGATHRMSDRDFITSTLTGNIRWLKQHRNCPTMRMS